MNAWPTLFTAPAPTAKHYTQSTAFWGAIGSLGANVLMLTSIPGTRPSDPVQYEHIVLFAIGFALLALIGTLLRNASLRGSLPPKPAGPRKKPGADALVETTTLPQNADGPPYWRTPGGDPAGPSH